MYWETREPLDVRCGAACDTQRLEDWYEQVLDEWGECGRVASEDEDVLGFIKYAPARYFPQHAHLPSGPVEDDTMLIACVHIGDDARRHGLGQLLLHAALRDAVLRGERTVKAFGFAGSADMRCMPMVGVPFLLRHGFTVSRPHPVYPLLEIDVRSLATWADNLEAVLESLRFPLRAPQGVPSPSIK